MSQLRASRLSLAATLTAAALSGIVLLAGCATTRLVDTWKDPAFTGPKFSRVLVVGISRSDANRRIFEDGFAGALQAGGTTAVASYPVMAIGPTVDNAQIDAAAGKSNADAVMVTRVLRVTRKVDVQPGYVSPGFYGRGFRGYYGTAWAAIPPDVDVYDVITIESTLWNMRTDKPVWSGTSEVTEPKSVAAATTELSKSLIAKMKADGVI